MNYTKLASAIAVGIFVGNIWLLCAIVWIAEHGDFSKDKVEEIHSANQQTSQNSDDSLINIDY